MIWFVPKGLSAGVVHSQMIQPLLSNGGAGDRHALALHVSDSQKIQDLETTQVQVYSNLKEMRRIMKSDNAYYTRSIADFFLVYFFTLFSRRKIHYSFRGLNYAESFYRNKSKVRKYILFILEFIIARLAHELSCVSQQMKHHLKTSFLVRKDIAVQYCGIAKVHKRAPSMGDVLHFVYVGGMSSWQRVEETLDLYLEIEKNLPTRTKLSIVTGDIALAQKRLGERLKHIESLEILSLAHAEIPAFLQTCDFGFLLRDLSVVNRVASPIKFLEYTSNGVIPIVSPAIGDYSDHVCKLQLGIQLTHPFTDDNICKKIQHLMTDLDVRSRLASYSRQFTHSNL